MAGAALVTLALVSSPVGWYHYQVMQYPSVALLAGFALQKQLWRLVAAVLVCGAFIFPVPAAVLRALDTTGAREIWVESPPRDPAWDGVRDRLSRAAAAFTD